MGYSIIGLNMYKINKNLINVPDFLYHLYDLNKFSTIKKLAFIFYAKIIQFVFKNFNEKVFCLLINFLIPKYSNINYLEGLYYKKLSIGRKIYYQNKRISRVISKEGFIFELLFNSYCLNKIDFKDNDVILDCGANVGELNFSFSFRGLKINYFGFEPDSETFKCLEKNKINGNEKLYNVALSNSNGKEKLYLDRIGGNSSIVYFGSQNFEIVNLTTLDSLNLPNEIKLLKLEAEGYEPEILEGAINTLKKVEFVSVDFGAERGEKNENTIVKVNDLLLKNKFSLVDFSNFRLIGLYKKQI